MYQATKDFLFYERFYKKGELLDNAIVTNRMKEFGLVQEIQETQTKEPVLELLVDESSTVTAEVQQEVLEPSVSSENKEVPNQKKRGRNKNK